MPGTTFKSLNLGGDDGWRVEVGAFYLWWTQTQHSVVVLHIVFNACAWKYSLQVCSIVLCNFDGEHVYACPLSICFFWTELSVFARNSIHTLSELIILSLLKALLATRSDIAISNIDQLLQKPTLRQVVVPLPDLLLPLPMQPQLVLLLPPVSSTTVWAAAAATTSSLLPQPLRHAAASGPAMPHFLPAPERLATDGGD